jgi:autotransporter-associated beta strand protein
VIAVCLLVLQAQSADAATLRWTGSGTSPLWSSAANWDALQVPADGDTLLFGGGAAQLSSVFDMTRTFASLAFTANAQAYALHVQGSGAVLEFNGTGVRNGTAGSGPIRQDLFADAGMAGGSIVFSGQAGINLGNASDLRPLNLTARGGASSGQVGGHIVLQDDAATSASTFDALRAEGASALGATGGEIVVRGNAVITRTASISVTGGTLPGALGAQASFSGLARVDAIVNVLAGDGGGIGAGVDVSGRATASAYASFNNQGGRSANAGGQGAITFRDDATLAGTVSNQAGQFAGAAGGQLEFRDRASHDTVGLDPSLGSVQIRNAGASVAGARGGSTVFRDDAAVRGASLLIVNEHAEEAAPGAVGGSTVFRDRAQAGQASITNQGGLLSFDYASTSFRDSASAGQALIVNDGGLAASAFGGGTTFDGHATAAAATLVMAGGATAQALGGFVAFYADTTAGSATLDMRSASVLGASGGRALFYDRASAGAAQITVAGSALNNVLGPEGGALSFANASTAANASITVGGNSFAGGGVGRLRFGDVSTAGNATILLAAGQTRGGLLSFEGVSATDLASAGGAGISNQGSSSGGPRGLAIGGQTSFVAFSTAGQASITNGAGFAPGLTSFFATSGAGDATVTNRGGLAGEDGGSTQFNNSASAERAVIVNQAGARGSSGFDAAGVTRFVDQASAGQARITAEGAGSSSAIGGLVAFSGAADPASATLIAEGGSGGGAGGRIVFAGLTNASQARVVLNAVAGAGAGSGGELDISGMSTARVAIGSLEGGGIVSLGSKNLTVWSPAANTSFSGLIRDGGINGGSGGSLSVTGGARLTLTGASTYSGGTRIGDGLNAGSGKLVAANTSGSATGTGAVVVDRGGTLAGSGFIGGTVSLMSGGVIAPGDPVTLSLNGGLTWNGGGAIRLVLGADAAGSDHLVLHSLVRGTTDGTPGAFVFELIDFGVTPGGSYELLQFDSIVGFSASDFSFSGVAGTFQLLDGRLAFTTSAVAEPGALLLLLLGLPVVGAAALAHQRARHGRHHSGGRYGLAVAIA